MRRDEFFTILSAQQEALRSFGVKSLAIFGSVVRDETRPESDLDLLVEFDDPSTFDRYMGLKLILEDLLGRRVDLVMRSALKPRLRSLVEHEAIRVA